MERTVLVENVSKATVVFKIENLNFKRVFKTEGAVIRIPFDFIYEGLSENSISNLFEQGYLAIKNKQDRIDLGLELEAESIEVNNFMSSSEIIELLKDNNPVKIKEAFEKVGPAQRDKIAQVAIENEIYNAGLAKFIKDYTGIDLLKSIQDRKIDLEDN